MAMTPLERLAMECPDMIAKDGRLSDKDKTDIIRWTREVQAAEDISNAELARIVGGRYSHSVISQVLNGKYKGFDTAVLLALRQFLRARADRVQTPDVDYVSTTDGCKVLTVCRHALAGPCMGRIVMPSGCGKTTSLREVQRRQAARCVYIQAGAMVSTRTSLLAEIAGALGLGLPKTELGRNIYRAVRQRLAGYYAGGKASPLLLLVDEATGLLPDALTLLRNLHDDPTCKLVVILSDTWRLDRELRNDGMRGMRGGYEQLRTRMGAVHIRRADEPMIAADVKIVADSVLASVGHKGKLHADSYKYLGRLAQTEGALRNVTFRIEAVSRMAEDLGAVADFSVAQLDYVATLVGGKWDITHGDVPFTSRRSTRAAGKTSGPAGRTAVA